MRHTAILYSVLIILAISVSLPAFSLAQTQGQSPAGPQPNQGPTGDAVVTPPIALDQYLKGLKKNGWNSKILQSPAGTVSLELTKMYVGSEKHGLFRISWDNQETWRMKYQPQGKLLVLLDAEGYRQHKAPLFGEWQTVGTFHALPSELFQKRLLVTDTLVEK